MSNLKHAVIAISALSVMGVAGVSLASCPTTLSPLTAKCLSNAADSAFQTNYKTYYNHQGVGDAAAYSHPAESAPQAQENITPPTAPKTNNSNNDDNDSNNSSIHWF